MTAPSFTCPDCGKVSHHPVDIREGWCDVCKKGDLERRGFAAGEHCHAGSDGDCNWKLCPQLVNYQTYCPLARRDEALDPYWHGM